MAVVRVEHPLAASVLTKLRARETPPAEFRALMTALGGFLAYEATRLVETAPYEIATPVAHASGVRLAKVPVVAPIMRAGLGLLEAFLNVVPSSVVAHLGFFRDPISLAAVPYYANVPDDLRGTPVFVLDPMLATGNSAKAALDVLAARGASGITFICAIAAPEGIAALAHAHPTAHVVTAAIDERLDEHGYIVPGLGDAGDRLYASATSLPAAYRAAHEG